jgi:hypothetical protein
VQVTRPPNSSGIIDSSENIGATMDTPRWRDPHTPFIWPIFFAVFEELVIGLGFRVLGFRDSVCEVLHHGDCVSKPCSR